MTPVTGAVADAEEDRFLFTPGPRQGLFAPGKPVDGVVGVLEEIGAQAFGKAVGHNPDSFCRDYAPGSLFQQGKVHPAQYNDRLVHAGVPCSTASPRNSARP